MWTREASCHQSAYSSSTTPPRNCVPFVLLCLTGRGECDVRFAAAGDSARSRRDPDRSHDVSGIGLSAGFLLPTPDSGQWPPRVLPAARFSSLAPATNLPSMSTPWPAAVLFDFDGVIVNSEPLHCDAFRRT